MPQVEHSHVRLGCFTSSPAGHAVGIQVAREHLGYLGGHAARTLLTRLHNNANVGRGWRSLRSSLRLPVGGWAETRSTRH